LLPSRVERIECLVVLSLVRLLFEVRLERRIPSSITLDSIESLHPFRTLFAELRLELQVEISLRCIRFSLTHAYRPASMPYGPAAARC
jgi:hypothetical protein